MAVPAIMTSAAVSTYTKEKPWLPSVAGCKGLISLFAGISLNRLVFTFANWVVKLSFNGQRLFGADWQSKMTRIDIGLVILSDFVFSN